MISVGLSTSNSRIFDNCMRRRIFWLVTLFFGLSRIAISQALNGTKPVDDADSLYIRTFIKSNDVRVFYGGQGNRLVLGSKRDGSADLTNNLFKNTNDFIGVGGAYKWLDGNISFSLPGTTYLKEERSNLDQFKLFASHTRRKISYRAYLSDSKGVVISGNNNEYESTPSLHEFRMGAQATYIFNHQRYSYRASLYQSELQVRTAGSFLFRGEFFFRDLGSSGQPMVPDAYDVETRFGEQVGLTYVKAPGFLLMPGYGVNFVFNNARFFVSPILMAGAGAAFNQYNTDGGKRKHVNAEYNAWFMLNAGYSGELIYSRLQFSYVAGYAPIVPAYLSSIDMTLSLLVGLRFKNFK